MLMAAQTPPNPPPNTPPNTDTHFAPPAFTSLDAWEKRKVQLRRQILFAAGLDPMPARTPLHPQFLGRIQTKDCIIEKVLIETMPGYYLGGNLYRPLNSTGENATGKLPAVLNPHGHWTYGRLENQPLYSGPQFGSNLAKQGYVVFAWDMIGYNDTTQTPHAFGSPAEQLWGFGPLGLQLWNSLRVVDFISSLDFVDPSRIAAAGASGGATQTILLAAVDDRINYFAPVNMVSLIMQGGDFCENAPGLRLGTNNVEIAAMIAPKPLLLVSATGDWTSNTPTEEYPAIRRIYELYGKPENVETLQLDAPHNFNKENREAVYRFFGKHIQHFPAADKLTERNAEVPMLQDMLALWGRTAPSNALTYPQIFEQWKHRPAADSKELLKLALATDWPADPAPAKFSDNKGVPSIVVGGPASNIDLSETRDHSTKHFLTFNKSDDAVRVQNIVNALAWVHKMHPGPIELVGVGTAGSVLAAAAAAVAPIEIRKRFDLSGFQGTDEDFLKYLNVPGIQLAGGLKAIE
jgi:dienelactone hydrolase